MACNESAIFLEYRDGGTAFDPRQDLPLDSRELSLEERPIGGLGWPLILHYCRLESCHCIDGENRYEFSILRTASGALRNGHL
jgi:hypothetical protein